MAQKVILFLAKKIWRRQKIREQRLNNKKRLCLLNEFCGGCM
jgi:hypothetical protein